MNSQNVTLITAAVAAIVSIANFLSIIINSRFAERRAQYRDLLKPYVTKLGEALHQIVACSQVACHRAANGEDVSKWVERAHVACNQLKELQRQIKYPLWNVKDGIRELARLSKWIDHTKSAERRERRNALLGKAEELRDALDEAIRDAYLKGRPPGKRQCSKVNLLAGQLRSLWNNVPDARLGIRKNQATFKEEPLNMHDEELSTDTVISVPESPSNERPTLA